jgi:ribosomal protein S15
MASYKDLKKEAKALSRKVIENYGKKENDGGLEVQIAVFTERIKRLSDRKDKTSVKRVMTMRRTQKDLISNYRRIDKEACENLEKKLGLK